MSINAASGEPAAPSNGTTVTGGPSASSNVTVGPTASPTAVGGSSVTSKGMTYESTIKYLGVDFSGTLLKIGAGGISLGASWFFFNRRIKPVFRILRARNTRSNINRLLMSKGSRPLTGQDILDQLDVLKQQLENNQIDERRIRIVYGPSGTGKTTLLKVLFDYLSNELHHPCALLAIKNNSKQDGQDKYNSAPQEYFKNISKVIGLPQFFNRRTTKTVDADNLYSHFYWLSSLLYQLNQSRLKRWGLFALLGAPTICLPTAISLALYSHPSWSNQAALLTPCIWTPSILLGGYLWPVMRWTLRPKNIIFLVDDTSQMLKHSTHRDYLSTMLLLQRNQYSVIRFIFITSEKYAIQKYINTSPLPKLTDYINFEPSMFRQDYFEGDWQRAYSQLKRKWPALRIELTNDQEKGLVGEAAQIKEKRTLALKNKYMGIIKVFAQSGYDMRTIFKIKTPVMSGEQLRALLTIQYRGLIRNYLKQKLNSGKEEQKVKVFEEFTHQCLYCLDGAYAEQIKNSSEHQTFQILADLSRMKVVREVDGAVINAIAREQLLSVLKAGLSIRKQKP